jgi:hypothetical protein
MGTTAVEAPLGVLRSPLALMFIGRQLWSQYAGTFSWILLIFLAVAYTAWVLLEAYFRSGILTGGTRNFRLFIASSMLKQLLLAVITTLILVIAFGQYLTTPIAEWNSLWGDSTGPALITGLIFIALWFALTLVETLVRASAVDLLGRDLFAISGLIATLVLFEAMIAGSAIGVGIILMSFVSNATGVLLLLSAGIVAIVVLNVLHSYLLVVRYSALDVLRRTSSVPPGPGIIEHVDEFRDDSHPGFWFPVHPTDRATHS